jgi:hypothetical protein
VSVQVVLVLEAARLQPEAGSTLLLAHPQPRRAPGQGLLLRVRRHPQGLEAMLLALLRVLAG